jgi:CheY-like chemotaxis protein
VIPTRKNVLVADDSEVDFLFLQRAFSMAGLSHVLLRVRDGKQALLYLRGEEPFEDRQRWPFPDLLVLDGKMPVTSGLEVLEHLRDSADVHVPAVVLSGSISPGDAQAALELGAAEYLSKPDSISELILLAQTIHYRWLSSPCAARG